MFITHWRFDERYREPLEVLLLESGAVSKGDAVAETMVKSWNALSSKVNFITALQKSGQKLDKLADEATAGLYSLIGPYWDKELAALLKKRGFRFKTLAAPGSKALHLVLASSPQVQAIKDLQKLGAKPENDEDAFKLACKLGDAKTVAKLTKKGGVDASLLSFAPNAKIAQLLIKAGADVKSVEKDGTSLIQSLIWSKAPADVLQVVIEAGAPLPEEPVSSVEHIEIAQVLSKAGCKMATENDFFPIRTMPLNS